MSENDLCWEANTRHISPVPPAVVRLWETLRKTQPARTLVITASRQLPQRP